MQLLLALQATQLAKVRAAGVWVEKYCHVFLEVCAQGLCASEVRVLYSSSVYIRFPYAKQQLSRFHTVTVNLRKIEGRV